ncbi:hypothetical protein Pryu01_02171 [Paraliobacillus ryukyuensis]|uniref:Type VII secretion effector (TIGR04197 family) n=1 Tax=Paraliobacillus ryukyuensis TaxID=200904 RepID=A0A366E3Z8_9BACI|nr:TIGR04197 family type VII secretion effector [Paraliobacillus ryukyuensis]RBO97096.1 type VII secretion effector (TIGR04197 family) [Paraliobacillus ryukyuensis]
MVKQVSINTNVFQSNVNKLKTSVSNIQTKKNIHSFSKTNIRPFTKDVEQIVDAIALLEKYKVILEADIVTLSETGDQMETTDIRLSNQYSNTFAPQLLK